MSWVVRVLVALIVVGAVLIGAGPRFEPRAQAAPSQLFIGQSCANGRVVLNLSWTPNNPAAVQTWFDVSLFDNGFARGTFVGAGPLPGQSTSFIWERFIPRNTHYVRLNQLLTDGSWDTSATWVMTTIDCPDAPGGTIVINPPGPGPVVVIGPTFQPGCLPNYPDICLPPGLGFVDCAMIPYRHFRVILQPDPYNLDKNNNGYGCDFR